MARVLKWCILFFYTQQKQIKNLILVSVKFFVSTSHLGNMKDYFLISLEASQNKNLLLCVYIRS